MFRKILVCLDGSKLSEQILQYASEEALHGEGKELVLLRAVSLSHSTTIAVPGVISSIPPSPPGSQQLAAEETEAREYLEDKAKSLKKIGVETQCVVLVGNAGEEILNYANKNKVDLIAIATHGRSGIKRMLFGSVTEYVVKNSKTPILLIKPK
ncbi:MAG: universal stress protein [Dehalococcoidia bacterium]|jgi:nucleotide-binding universal stress UspA family protein